MAALGEDTYVTPECSVSTFAGEIVILVIHSAMTLEALHYSEATARRLALRGRRKGAGLTLVNGIVRIPGPELRRAIDQSVKDSIQHTRCTATVLSGSGFWLSTMRSVLTAMEFIRPGDMPRRTFQVVPPATRFLAEQLGHDGAWAEKLTLAAHAASTIGQDAVASG
jgi:hypothetical protein